MERRAGHRWHWIGLFDGRFQLGEMFGESESLETMGLLAVGTAAKPTVSTRTWPHRERATFSPNALERGHPIRGDWLRARVLSR